MKGNITGAPRPLPAPRDAENSTGVAPVILKTFSLRQD